jgi:Na+/H+ antiporter NhaD/arsenite permease-like protein
MTDPLVSAAEAMAIGARLDGAEIGFAWSLPFIGLLLSIAVFPLLAPYFWERQFGKVAALWTFALLLPCAVVFGLRTTAAQVLHTFLLDYLPFIILLFTLFVVAGGIRVSGNLVGTPATNSALLTFGTLSASLLGTTGASMVLIRPVIRANQDHHFNVHVFLFFISWSPISVARSRRSETRPSFSAFSRASISCGRWSTCSAPCCS